MTRYAVPREPSPGLAGRYCSESDLWVVDTQEGAVPAALHRGTEMATETRGGGEASDRSLVGEIDCGTDTAVAGEQSDMTGAAMIAMLATITEVHGETSADRTGEPAIAAMATETAVGGEQSDRRRCAAWLAMETVTKVDAEQTDR
ncbi:hypothetical protein [Rhodoblastus sp.]|uniref:hypothetical protein n=1 Tax=Rhodoblastus sp. TaxID=1962975 RepID=UPI0025CF7B67|nr:hypothetical protein [Rhodoblastus sp.]